MNILSKDVIEKYRKILHTPKNYSKIIIGVADNLKIKIQPSKFKDYVSKNPT